MPISTVSTTNTFLEEMVLLNQAITAVNKMTEGIAKTTGNVEITNAGAPGTVALNVANGFIKGNVYGTTDLPGANLRAASVRNAGLQNNGIMIIGGNGIHTGNVTVNLGGQIIISAQVSLSLANTSQTAPAAANTVNTVHGIALASAAGVGSAFAQANSARDQANTGVTTAAAAFGVANSATTSAASGVSEAAIARGKANTACTQSDSAGTQANAAFAKANAANSLAQIGNFQVVLGDGVDIVTAGPKGFIHVSCNGIISRWDILGDVSGNCAFDIWKVAYSGHPPTAGGSMTSNNCIRINGAATKNQQTSPTAFTDTTIRVGDTLFMNLVSVNNFTLLTVSVDYTKTV